MRGRYANKRDKKKALRPLAVQVAIEESRCQEHPDHRAEDDMQHANKNSKGFIDLLKDKVFDTAAAALFVSTLALVAYFWQACIMRTTMRVDQRAYLIAKDPAFNGKPEHPEEPVFVANEDLYARVKVTNTGKTPSSKTHDVIALVRFPTQSGDAATQRRAFRNFLDGTFKELEDTARNDMQQMSWWTAWGGDVAPDGEFYFSQNGTPLKLSDAEFTDIKNGGHGGGAVFLVGVILYDDMFGDHHETEYCWYHIGSDPHEWVRCQSHMSIR